MVNNAENNPRPVKVSAVTNGFKQAYLARENSKANNITRAIPLEIRMAIERLFKNRKGTATGKVLRKTSIKICLKIMKSLKVREFFRDGSGSFLTFSPS
jgi:hypothetical protein